FLPVAAGGRALLRQLHDAHAHADLNPVAKTFVGRSRICPTSADGELEADHPGGFAGGPKSIGGGRSGTGISILIFEGSMPEPRSIQYVTDAGQKMTMTTRMTCSTTQGIAPQ